MTSQSVSGITDAATPAGSAPPVVDMVTLTARIAYPGSRISDLLIGGYKVQIPNDALAAALVCPEVNPRALEASTSPVDTGDAARLDWLMSKENRNLRVQGADDNWSVLDCSNGLVFITRNQPSSRAAIDAAIACAKPQGNAS